MKNLTLLSIVTSALIVITGCGGSSDSSTPSDDNSSNNTPTPLLVGYYVDEVIAGATYSCASTTSTTVIGTTNSSGMFNYTAGQICTFSVGGLSVEVTGTLEDNATVITEDDSDDLGYLLTLDDNGNPNDGILITPSVESNASTYNTNNANSTTSDVTLSDIAAVISSNDGNYTGVAATTTQTTTQVTNAQASQCVRSLIGGKTWFIVEGQGTEIVEYVVDVPVANTLVTKVHPTPLPPNNNTATEQVVVVGDQLWIELDPPAGRDFAKFQACKASSPTFTNYLEAKFYTAATNQQASMTAGTEFRWYNNLADAIIYSNTGM